MKYFQPLVHVAKQPVLLFLITLSFNTVIAQESMRANLYISDANGLTLADGNYTNYDNAYCNCVDWDDAWKMNNQGENFGITRENISLVVERRKIICEKDTTTFRMWNLQQNRNYRIEVINQQLDHPYLFAFFKDHYLGTTISLSLSGTTVIEFNINSDPQSYALSRFQVIYEKIMGNPLPVSFTAIKAYRRPGFSIIEWQVENEVSISKYIVEKSPDGRVFNAIEELMPRQIYSSGYQVRDNSASLKEIFYRIKAISRDGKVQLSEVVNLAVRPDNSISSFKIYPNPVINKNLNLNFANYPGGKYAIQLIGANGIVCNLNTVILSGSQQDMIIKIPGTVPPGNYRLVIFGEGNIRTNTNVNIL